jgi:serine/threonine protein kinase
MIDENENVKIADFGVANVFEENDMLKKTEGTYHFLSPECCDRKILMKNY